MRSFNRAALALSLVFLPAVAWSATYTVGPSGRQYTQLSTVFSSNNLAPGDIVEVDGNATYNGNIVVNTDDAGTAANPIIIRWRRAAGQTRPVLQGGTHTIKFQQSNHVVFEGFEITGGSSTCLFSEANDVTVRDVLIRDCPGHGILAADQLSGSFTLEYSEIRNAGSSSNRHPIYMQSDEVAFPGSVFRMRYNYIHSGRGGNLVKVRHERSEIHYNWLEGSAYQAIELIGPDCWTQQNGWSTGLKREDADVVGNVIIQSGSWANAIRIGGDLNGRSQGRVRLVNNTILFTRSGTANAVMVQLGAGSLEMHNNVIHQTTSGAPVVVKENNSAGTPEPCEPQSSAAWTAGRKVAGSNNWVKSGSDAPSEWTGTRSGSDPGLANIAQLQLRPTSGSALVGNGANPPATPSAFPFPSPLAIPQYDPPLRAKMAIGAQKPRVLSGGRISIGALEVSEGSTPPAGPILVNGSQPMVPSRGSGSAGAVSQGAAIPSLPVAPAGSTTPSPVVGPVSSPGTFASADLPVVADRPGANKVRKYANPRLQTRYVRWNPRPVALCDSDESVDGGDSICK
ncbi:hypothetical protein [Pseudoxanthomonas putridarboris]|uniref:Right handed beta helix region n=1 Tax=Pseudoxanthomonas putridarboris TaxID=752605 RepID=A0ABU9IYB7_9GAMM